MTTTFTSNRQIDLKSFHYDFSDKKTTSSAPLITTLIISASMLMTNVSVNLIPKVKHIRYSTENNNDNFISFNKDDRLKVDIDEHGGVSMTDLSHKDILNSERRTLDKIEDLRASLKSEFLDETKATNKIVEDLSSEIKSTNTKIDSLQTELIKLNANLVSLQSDVSHLPDKLKASRWDTLLKSAVIPIIITLLSTFLLIKFGLK